MACAPASRTQAIEALRAALSHDATLVALVSSSCQEARDLLGLFLARLQKPHPGGGSNQAFLLLGILIRRAAIKCCGGGRPGRHGQVDAHHGVGC